jgi:branched-subunit amino acid aminotransferase/4-amino-4-deoxychorismate lyase
LQGITRSCAITLARDMGFEVREERLPRADRVLWNHKWGDSGPPRLAVAGGSAAVARFQPCRSARCDREPKQSRPVVYSALRQAVD